MWIIKPGECSNQGRGVQVVNNNIQQIENIIFNSKGEIAKEQKTFIVQKYIKNPLLYKNRKFDIRCYQLITSVNGVIKGYWYEEGYVRTSSMEYSIQNMNKFIHLTNDAIQRKDHDNYGKQERGNKITFENLSEYIMQEQ